MHETKHKGDIGIASVIRDLTINGFYVALPLSDHLPLDLLVISPDYRVRKISVKYRKVVDGAIPVILRSVYQNRKGNYARVATREEIDGVAVYCPDTDSCYYVPIAELTGAQTSLLLPVDGKRKQASTRLAINYRDPNKLFG